MGRSDLKILCVSMPEPNVKDKRKTVLVREEETATEENAFLPPSDAEA